jgi:hypothetical protein
MARSTAKFNVGQLVLAFVFVACSGPTYADCVGKQRWDVKTAADNDAKRIVASPEKTTIAKLVQLKRPPALKRTSPRTKGTEEHVYVLEATLVKFFSEADQDRHLVLRSGERFMVAEIPDLRCVPSTARFRGGIQRVRAKFGNEFKRPDGTPRKSQQVVNRRVRITGVGFFDSPHIVTNAAPNFIELHPVLDIVFLD